MNLISRKPREIADAPKDYRPPAARAPDLDEIADRYRANAARRIPITETESEVMPIEGVSECTQPTSDTRPASAMRADRLAEIATLIRQLTYGEMIELAAAVWRNRPDDAPVTQETLPGILHRWSACLKAKENSE